MGASRRVGYAVVGLGRIAERAILPAFRNSKRARLVALVSGDDHKAKRLARQFGAEDFFSYDDFAFCLSHPKVEAVYIATANQLHAELTERAAAAGKHVLCEKPMATSVEGCLGMIQACRMNSVRLMVAYRKYFEPASLALKKLVESGKLGRLKFMHSAFTFCLAPREKGWAGLNPAYAYDEERRLFGKIQGRWFEKRFRVIDEFALELDAFAGCVRRRREPEPNGVEGMKDVSVMQAVYRSVREGRPVAVSYPPPLTV